MKFDFTSCGTRVTTTEKLQLALWARASEASHVTLVVPLLNSVPDAGVQTTLTGGAPFEAVGTSNVTVGFVPLCAVTLMSVGHATTGSSIGGLG